jgi:hypothetical protein
MSSVRRLAAVTLAAVLTSLGLLPTESASAGGQAFVNIHDNTSYEYSKTCSSPSSCNVISDGSVWFAIVIQNRPKPNHSIDIGWELVDVTATAGVDYTGPTSGLITIGPNQSYAPVLVPLVNDGVAEPSETVELHITSISEQVDISDVGVGTIQDGAQIPEDCSLAYIDNYERSLTCAERPTGQQWHLNVGCLAFGLVGVAIGNTVTGNGTSNARCTQGGYAGYTAFVLES